MIKVLVADDELLVRIGLRTTIDWEKNGFTIVGEAKNGKEAVELFEKFDADILITDIRMPVLDGLEVIKRLKEQKKDLKSIILTHYDDFSYAQKAIKLGASEFILKNNLSSDNLLLILKKLSEEIPDNMNNIKSLAETDQLNYVLEKAIIANISKISFEDLVNVHEGHLFLPYFFVAYGKICCNDELELDVSNSEFLKNLSNVFVSKDNVKQAMMIIEEDHLVYLYNIDFKTENHKKEQIEITNILKRNIKQFFDLDMFFGVSTVGDMLPDIPRLVKEGKKACERCFFSEDKLIHYDQSIEKITDENIKIKPDHIRRYLDRADMKGLFAYIDERFDKIYGTYNKMSVRKLFIDFISLAQIIYQEKFNEEEVINDAKFRYIYFDKLADFNAIKEYVKGVYHFISMRHGDKTYSYYIYKSIQFIKENYERNITLEEVAENSQISKSYLSLLFKQETGINFSTFLTNYRIEKCKEYMKESHYKIYEIAERVGFDNPYYFSKVFKEKVGISCKEYQKKYYKEIRS
ncbi:MAG: response regulator [Eubacteriales bacterium]|nr:response regulator [Eubacteriales bacterium]